jgi:hypothetical protein
VRTASIIRAILIFLMLLLLMMMMEAVRTSLN